jgi:hypothetical protein
VSYLANWTLYPFPAPDAKANTSLVYQQQLQCVTSGASAWSFHLDTRTYTAGCKAPPATFDDPCDSVMFEQVSNAVGTLATLHGAFVGCSEIGSHLIVAVNGTQLTDVVPGTTGDPAPGLVVCDAGTDIASSHAAAKQHCGLGRGPAQLATWKFVPLPVASGPIDSVSTNIPLAELCLEVGTRSFSYAAATGAVSEGCH